MAVEQHAAFLRIVKAEQEAQKRGFPDTTRSDERDQLARLTFKVDALEDGAVWIVAKPHVLEAHDAVGSFQCAGGGRVVDRGARLENFDDATERGQRSLDRGGDAADRAHR